MSYPKGMLRRFGGSVVVVASKGCLQQQRQLIIGRTITSLRRNSTCKFTGSGDKNNNNNDEEQPEEHNPNMKLFSFRVDRSGMPKFDYNNGSTNTNDHKQRSQKGEEAELPTVEKEPLTPLATELQAYIRVRGLISLNEFMLMASQHVKHGYYHNDNTEKITSSPTTTTTTTATRRSHGDFVTSPEISKMFGEMIAIWCLRTWEKLGKPKQIKIIELGPGNGTLMKDILSTVSVFHEFQSSVSVCMIELSQTMRGLQREKLEVTKVDSKTTTSNTSQKGENSKSNNLDDEGVSGLFKTKNGVTIQWFPGIRHLNDTKEEQEKIPMLFIGQEFLDAFPVHHFVQEGSTHSTPEPSTSSAASSSLFSYWREKLVDVDTSNTSPYHFRPVISPNETAASNLIFKRYERYFEEQGLLSAPTTTPSLILPPHLQKQTPQPQQKCIEVSPMALAAVEMIGNLILKNTGAALMIDYGEDYTQSDTLRAYYQHQQQQHIFSLPGLMDVTADVDFYLCRKTLSALKSQQQQEQQQQQQLFVPPVKTQKEFLLSMGILERLEQVINVAISSTSSNNNETATATKATNNAEDDDDGDELVSEEVVQLLEATKRLLDDKEMGKRFKVLQCSYPHHILPADNQ